MLRSILGHSKESITAANIIIAHAQKNVPAIWKSGSAFSTSPKPDLGSTNSWARLMK